jgi:hypothetical protein
MRCADAEKRHQERAVSALLWKTGRSNTWLLLTGREGCEQPAAVINARCTAFGEQHGHCFKVQKT